MDYVDMITSRAEIGAGIRIYARIIPQEVSC